MKYIAPAYANKKVETEDIITKSYTTAEGVHIQETVNEDNTVSATLSFSIKNLLG